MKKQVLALGLLLTSLMGQPTWAQTSAAQDEAQLINEQEMQQEKKRQEETNTYPYERQEEQAWEEGDLQIQEEEVRDADPEFAPIDDDLESEAY